MKFDVLKDGVKVGCGNYLMFETYTDEDIKEFYSQLGYEVEIERDKEEN